MLNVKLLSAFMLIRLSVARRIIYVALSLDLLFPMPGVQAQGCLRPQPSPACHTFLITEVGLQYRVNSISYDRFPFESREYFTSDLGLMINLCGRYALGFGNFIGVSLDGHFRGGLKLRAKRWLGAQKSVDLSAGPLLWDDDGSLAIPSFTVDVSYHMNRWLAMTFLIEYLRTKTRSYRDYHEDQLVLVADPGVSDVAFHLGVKAGSTPGLVANAAAATAGAVFFLLYLSIGD